MFKRSERPSFNYWICYGGGLIAGVLSYVVFDGDFWASVIAVVAWFVTYTFFASAPADKTAKSGGGAAGASGQAVDSQLSRQVRRAKERRAAKARNKDE